MTKIGDVYKDKDKRCPDRFLRVAEVSEPRARLNGEREVLLQLCDEGGFVFAKKTTRISTTTLKRRFTKVVRAPEVQADAPQ